MIGAVRCYPVPDERGMALGVLPARCVCPDALGEEERCSVQLDKHIPSSGSSSL